MVLDRRLDYIIAILADRGGVMRQGFSIFGRAFLLGGNDPEQTFAASLVERPVTKLSSRPESRLTESSSATSDRHQTLKCTGAFVAHVSSTPLPFSPPDPAARFLRVYSTGNNKDSYSVISSCSISGLNWSV